jgi:DMSO/TMAO reductase YedYZ molybdopterin-dependent catalytic subunit
VRRLELGLPALLFALTTVVAVAEGPPGVGHVSVQGAVATPKSLTRADLVGLGAVEADWSEHGTAHHVRGVPLGKVLSAAGFSSGPMGKDVSKKEKRSGWKMAVRVTGSDGYQTVFSCAELMEDMGATRALLVWEVDGKPLDAERGPFRIVVLTDKEPSRSVHQVQTIEVVDLRT